MSAPTVRRIVDETGSHIEPPLNEKAASAEKLAWMAAVASVDTGLEVTVEPAHYTIGRIRQRGYYNVRIAGSSTSGPRSFYDAWSYLNGVVSGVQAARPRP